MREVTTELKQLRLPGTAGAWADFGEQGGAGIEGSRPVAQFSVGDNTKDQRL